jgi:hypothetical protein
VTAVPANPRVSELRDLFRYLSDFRATYEACGLDVITTPHGNTWSLWDLEYLYKIVCQRLTRRQQQAITLCLIHGVRESDAAEMMGVSRTNPVMMYATLGLQRLLDMIDYGEIERFNKPLVDARSIAARHADALEELAKEIEISGCWLFPNRSPRAPRLMVRSASAATGYVTISPMQVLWQVQIGPIPAGCDVEHSERIPRVSIACVRPQHGELSMPHEVKARQQTLALRHIRSRQGAST